MAGRPNSGKNLRVMGVVLADQQIAQLKERAHREGRSISELIRAAIRDQYQMPETDEAIAKAV